MTSQLPYIETKSTFLSLPELQLQPLNANTAKAWLRLKNLIAINGIQFSQLANKYRLAQRDSYTDSRQKRLYHLLNDYLISPLLPETLSPDEQTRLKIAQKLLGCLSPSIYNLWQNTLHNRLCFRSYQIKSSSKGFISINVSQAKIELNIAFETTGTATWFNNDWDEEDKDDPKNIVICSTPSLLYSGQSSFVITIDDQADLGYELKAASGKLYAREMRKAFITPSLDEQIDSYVYELSHQSDAKEHDEEIDILVASRDYYLGTLSEQEVQRRYISANFYNPAFRESKAYLLIEQVLQEKPFSQRTSE